MSQFPDFTIALPVYNGGLFLKACIESILTQSYPYFILQVYNSFDNDDGSTEYLNSLTDERLQILQADRKLSIEENWGRFKDSFNTEFGTIIGQDDLLNPDFLVEMKKLIAEYPGASLWHSHYNIIDATNAILETSKPLPKSETLSEYIRAILTVSAETVGTGYVFRCSQYKQIGGIQAFQDLLFADFALWIQLTSFGYKVNSPDILYSFRIHQSTTSRASPRRYFNGFTSFIKFLLNQAEANEEIRQCIISDINAFLVYYAEVISLRIIKSRNQQKEQARITVQEVLNYCKQISIEAGKIDPPRFTYKTKLAAKIDKHFFLKKAFVIFKKIYPNPILR